MSLSSDIKKMSFEVTCENCGKSFNITGKDFNHDVECPHCHVSIHIDSREFDQQIKQIEHQLNHLFD